MGEAVSIDSAKRRVEHNYPRIAHQLLGPLLELLASSRRELGGDLDKFLIIMAIGLRTTSQPEYRLLEAAEILAGKVDMPPTNGTNSGSIADSLGIARETTRRKVVELVQAGWVMRERGRLYLTERALRGIAPLRLQMIDLAVRYHDVVERLADAPAEPRSVAGIDGRRAALG